MNIKGKKLVKIEEKMLTKNKQSRPDRLLTKVKAIVIHYVGGVRHTHSDVANYFESLKNQEKIYASAHYIVGLRGEIVQCIPDNEMAYHVGARTYTDYALKELSTYPNNCTIGIEMCHIEEGFTPETVQATAALTALLLKKHNLTIENVIRHYDVTGKICPKFYVEDAELWEEFKNLILQ